ncbi:hypothetical protein CSB20_06830 [bacterium DOLZORAL124_64_63]|nr:MAG: hypothetical protein CSB20_06830 [bacterium DOLZORAL124_64_63]
MSDGGFSRTLTAADRALRQAVPERQSLSGRDLPNRDLAGLKAAAEQFEGVFLNTMLKAMRATVPDNELFNSSGPTKFYQQMLDSEMATAMATGPSRVGVADLIVRQFQATVDGDAEGAPRILPRSAPVSAPASAPMALERYRSMGEVTGEVAQRLRLRARAADAGAAVADTLSRFETEIHTAAQRAGVDPALVLAVVMQESGGDPLAVSPRGATGLMQLMPTTAAELGVQDATCPAQNIAGGSRYLQKMLTRYDGDLELALAAYNAGPGHVDRAGRSVPGFAETRRYVQKVQNLYRQLGGTNMAPEK